MLSCLPWKPPGCQMSTLAKNKLQTSRDTIQPRNALDKKYTQIPSGTVLRCSNPFSLWRARAGLHDMCVSLCFHSAGSKGWCFNTNFPHVASKSAVVCSEPEEYNGLFVARYLLKGVLLGSKTSIYQYVLGVIVPLVFDERVCFSVA